MSKSSFKRALKDAQRAARFLFTRSSIQRTPQDIKDWIELKFSTRRVYPKSRKARS